MCIKPLSQFSSHPNETFYIKSLWRVEVHNILVMGSICPFLKFKHFHNRESYKSNPMIHLIPMKSQYLSHTFCEAWYRGYNVMSLFFKTHICVYREGVSISFHNVQVNNMICIMFWLIFCDKVGIGCIFITMNDSSLLFLTSKPIFPNSNLQYTRSVWAVWRWIMSLLKQLKCRSFGGSLAP